MPADPAELAELLDLAAAAAHAAAELLLGALHVRPGHGRAPSRPSTDMVTEMDHAVRGAASASACSAPGPTTASSARRPARRAGTSGIRWVVDPLDGTTNYLYGHPGFNVSIAAEDDDGAVVGVVVDPLRRRRRSPPPGAAAPAATAQPIACSTKGADDLATALCATGFAYDPDRRRRQAAVLAEVLPQVRDIRRMGAAAVDLCSVACGRVDAYWERGLGPWDLAAGALVAAEAGATVAGDAELGLHPGRPAGALRPPP